MATWTEVWAELTQQLGADDARWIVEAASGHSGASWLLLLERTASESGAERAREMAARRLTGEPLQYVVGRWGFRQLDLHVDTRVLIPRPETEQVVEAALAAVAGREQPVLVDLGTGSGAIALSLALEVPSALVVATDASMGALEVAQANALSLGEDVQARLRFAHGTWFDALPDALRGKVDMIVSNPPYVAETERSDLDDVVIGWEPHSALFAGDDGLDDLRVIVDEAGEWLRPDGMLFVELAPTQAMFVQELAQQKGFRAEIGIDFAGRQRWVAAFRQ